MSDEVLYDDPQLYDEQYRDYRDDLPFYRRLADDYGAPLLELGAGTGRVTLALAQSGHRVVAVESNPAMLARARTRLSEIGLIDRVELIAGDMRDLALGRRFPLVLAPFNTLMHALTPSEQDATLSAVRGHLEPGGAFGFDLFVPRFGALGVLRREREWLHVGGGRSELFVVQHHDEVAQLIESDYYLDSVVDGRLVRRRARLVQRYYTRFELLRALRQAGFEQIRIFGGFDRAHFDAHAPLMAGIAS